jgi:signal transduction histidine kinase
LHNNVGSSTRVASAFLTEGFGRLSRELELAIFRIVQECLTNVYRHSGSKIATIRVRRDDQIVSLAVEDEGRGISAETLPDIEWQGVGIRGIRERALQFGGELKIESDRGGTKISVTFPFARTAELKAAVSAQRAKAFGDNSQYSNQANSQT